MPKSILIVDDNPVMRRTLMQLFQAETWIEVCGEAVNGRDAIEKAQQLHPDLIVLDLAMPVMNGLEAATALKHIMPAVPLILFTLHKSAVRESAASAAGISVVVSKSDVAALISHAQTLLNCATGGISTPGN